MNAILRTNHLPSRQSATAQRLIQGAAGVFFLSLIVAGIACAALLFPDLLRKNW